MQPVHDFCTCRIYVSGCQVGNNTSNWRRLPHSEALRWIEHYKKLLYVMELVSPVFKNFPREAHFRLFSDNSMNIRKFKNVKNDPLLEGFHFKKSYDQQPRENLQKFFKKTLAMEIAQTKSHVPGGLSFLSSTVMMILLSLW